MAALFITACRKPDADLGLELLPGDELGVATDTAFIHAFSFTEDRLRTSGLSRNLLGSYLDPQFGTVRTGIVTQLLLSSSNVGAGQDTSGLQADSLVLSLVFDPTNYAYGGLGSQKFEVFEVNETLSVDTLYYSDDVPEIVDDDLVASHSGIIAPKPLTSVLIEGDTMAPQLRIRLDHSLAERFMNAFGSPNMVNDAAFLQFFKGIYITVNNGQQIPFQDGILYFDLVHPDSRATLFYHDQLDTVSILRQFSLPITSNSVRYTVVEHVHDQAVDPAIIQAMTDTIQAANTVFVQALGGSRAALRFPGIMEYGTEGRILARAELIAPVQGSFNPYLPPPSQLFLFRLDSLGDEVFLPDQLGGVGTIDGNYRSQAREYRFNITRYIQGVLNGQIPNNGLEMVAGSSGISANRVVLAGPGEGDYRMRLLLTFTTY